VQRHSALFALAALVPATLPAQADPVARLARLVEDGRVQVRFDDQRGYLPWLLEALGIPEESQMLVFSKTSVQGIRVSPDYPRRLFFNDSAIVGSVKGGPLELAAQDPERGMVFYFFDQNRFRSDRPTASPKAASPFSRREDCVHCHAGKSGAAAELLIRSVVTSDNGAPLIGRAALDTDDRTPFDKLWGGWYVTGRSEARHMGNSVVDQRGKTVAVEPPGSSDIVALMVFEHQMHMMNLIAEARTPDCVNELVDYMLFVDEAPLAGKVEGSSGFAQKFTSRGPRDSRGRSLRDLDLNRRLMRYPCSYMIYSEAFDAIPAPVKAAIYRRMWEVLGKRDEADRRAIVEILRETKPGLPDYFSSGAR